MQTSFAPSLLDLVSNPPTPTVQRVIPKEETEAQKKSEGTSDSENPNRSLRSQSLGLSWSVQPPTFHLPGSGGLASPTSTLEGDVIVLPELLSMMWSIASSTSLLPQVRRGKCLFYISFHLLVALGKHFIEQAEEEERSRQCTKRVQKCGSRTEGHAG